MSELCDTCPLAASEAWQNCPADFASLRNREDVERIAEMPNASGIRNALRQSLGTERCDILRAVLPESPITRGRVVEARSCPEFRLLSQIVEAPAEYS